MDAGLFTAVYILTRAVEKCKGAYAGAEATHSPDTIRQTYLELV